ncbi:hypothetical protein VTK73DRAFT_7564 [Phialemonium thermophilum]|uniref:Uncharacterized protein n=1 Tax=Phialemonium thermophilum TaxID=223376 RepID=A0ABR3XS26_9PEZI
MLPSCPSYSLTSLWKTRTLSSSAPSLKLTRRFSFLLSSFRRRCCLSSGVSLRSGSADGFGVADAGGATFLGSAISAIRAENVDERDDCADCPLEDSPVLEEAADLAGGAFWPSALGAGVSLALASCVDLEVDAIFCGADLDFEISDLEGTEEEETDDDDDGTGALGAGLADRSALFGSSDFEDSGLGVVFAGGLDFPGKRPVLGRALVGALAVVTG